MFSEKELFEDGDHHTETRMMTVRVLTNCDDNIVSGHWPVILQMPNVSVWPSLAMILKGHGGQQSGDILMVIMCIMRSE